jgi:hypothetical protein
MIAQRQVLKHRMLTSQEQGQRMKADPSCKPPEPRLFDLERSGELSALDADRRLHLQLEASSHTYQARLQHFQAIQEGRLISENQTEFIESWVPLKRQYKAGAAGNQGMEGIIVILCSPPTLAAFFQHAQEGLVLLASVRAMNSGPKGTLWGINRERIIPLFQPHLRPNVFLPLDEPPTFPLQGEGIRRKTINECYQTGGLWTPMRLSDSYDPIRDGV